jgi:RNA polymerase sigma-70 factor, ECF subfamily
VVALNRAVAVAVVAGPAAALDLIEGLDLPEWHLYHAVRGDLLERLDRRDEAARAFETAASLAGTSVERAHLLARRDAVAGGRGVEGS